MKAKKTRSLIIVGCLIFATCGVMAYTDKENPHAGVTPPSQSATSGNVTVTGSLVQDKVFSGGDGIVELSLTLKADDAKISEKQHQNNVDMVIVLDRSGSMQGNKIEDAKDAVVKLANLLTDRDRFSLISYSDRVTLHSGLIPVTGANLAKFTAMVRELSPGGGTNLGAGLRQGLNALIGAERIGNPGRVILISDGLANQGITDPAALSKIASSAARQEFAVSTVGVGIDFNEHLMTALADHGTGNYYYLENPSAFAGVFEKEFRETSLIAAGRVAVEIPLPHGVSLVYAAGYPIEVRDRTAVFYPGDLVSGRTRKLFLRFSMPTRKDATHAIHGIMVTYKQGNSSFAATVPGAFRVTCVDDPEEAAASVNKGEWVGKVLHSDYNRLREAVAADIQSGDEKKALGRIEAYHSEKEAMNRVIDSAEVTDNLENDVAKLRQTVQETFSGPAAAVPMKQKKNAKAMQYEGYKGKRSAK